MSDDESLSRYFDRLYMHHHQRLSASQHQGGRRAAATMCLVMIAVVFGALHQANGACLGTGSSIRIMNYNVALLIPPFDNEAEIGMEDMDRVDAIANRILHGGGDPDVVALEEVWRIDAQIRFILKLQAKYPHYVKNQLGGQWWTPAYTHDRQGGLMLFSKYPLAQFTNTVDTPWFLVNGRTGGSTFSIAGPNTQVAATMFTTCSSYDCLQDKGAVMVRILNECTQQVFNVVWTHLQASYDDADQNAKNGFFNDRLAQLTAIKRMITTSLTSSQLKNEAVYFVGDLNIDGNLHKPLTTEWTTHFSSTAVDGGFFACNTPTCTFNPPASHTGTFLKDSWAFESSPTDFGPTAAWSDIGAANYDLDAGFPSFFMAGKRFDYIFHNVPSERDLCMQHIVVAHDMKGAVDDKKGNAKGKNYSDHLPIRGDFNKAFARCTPRRKDASNPFGAETVDVTSGPTDAFPHAGDTSTRIANPGGMQWYILGKAGTYSMPISPGFKRVIYQGGDLSTPMDLYGAEKSERYGLKYSLTEPPYFVRVFGATRTTVGNYSIQFHKYQCSDSGNEACLLEPAQKVEHEWPNSILNQEDTAWWAFYTDTAHPSNGAPALSFILESNQPDDASHDHNVASVKVYESDGTTLVTGVTETSWVIAANGASYTKTISPPTLGGEAGNKPKRYLIAVKRKAVNATTKTSLLYGTTLTYLVPTSLMCHLEQTDGPGLDDTWGRFFYDGVSAAADYTFIHVFDEGQSNPVPASLRGSFVSSFLPKLWEDSDLDMDELVPGQTFAGPFVDYLEHKTLPATVSPLEPNTAMRTGSFSFSDAPFSEDERDFFYTLHFKMAHKQLCSSASQCGNPTEVQCSPQGLCQEKD